MRIVMAQISSSADPAENLVLVEEATAAAAADGADLVVFPEATMCRFGVPLGPVAQPLDGPWATAVSNLAARFRLTIVAGMFTPASDGPDGRTRVTNTVLVASPDRRRGYDKIHLFDAFGFTESDTVAAGAAPLTFDVGDVTVGVATCYDIRFPALFTELARRGAQVIVVPTSWGAGSGKLHQWQVLATARALDCTSFVVAVGQAEPSDPEVAAGPAPTGIGHSQITDPLGSVVVAYGSAPELGAHDIDVALVEKARAALGVLDNAVDFGSSPTPGR